MAEARDRRRVIVGAIDVVFTLAYVGLALAIPNRMASAQAHLWGLPIACGALAAGTLVGGRRGYRLAIAGATAQLAVVVALIARVLVSAAFLAGVYGAMGRALAGGALVAVAVIVEVAGLLPVLQLRWLRSAAGRRAFARTDRA